MIKVVKEGRPLTMLIVCKKCGAHLEIEPEDVYLEYVLVDAYGVKCPCCNTTTTFSSDGMSNAFRRNINARVKTD